MLEISHVKASVIAEDVSKVLAILALKHDCIMSSNGAETFARGVIAGFAEMLGAAAAPGKEEETATTFGKLLTEAIRETNRLKAVERGYGEFSFDGVAKRVLAGVELQGREAEFALGLKLIDREGKPSDTLLSFAAKHGIKPA